MMRINSRGRVEVDYRRAPGRPIRWIDTGQIPPKPRLRLDITGWWRCFSEGVFASGPTREVAYERWGERWCADMCQALSLRLDSSTEPSALR